MMITKDDQKCHYSCCINFEDFLTWPRYQVDNAAGKMK